MTVLSILAKGGYVMFAIAIAAWIGLYIVIERFLYYRRIRTDADSLLKEIKAHLHAGDINSALEVARRHETPLGKMALSAVAEFKEPPETFRTLLDAKAKEGMRDIEKGLGVLSTVVAISPLLGFFGTVTGMIKAFMKIEILGGMVNPSQLAGGIWEALVTTAAGLGVAIVFLVFYNILSERGRRYAGEIERLGNELEVLHRECGAWK